jgi:inner membrane protein
MDSLSQLVLGSAVGIAVMGRRTAVWKAALWGGVCGTLPDLDALIDHGDPILNMTLHRGDSHSLFWLTLLAPGIAAMVARIHGEMPLWRRWWLAVWLALITHPLLDWTTIYGTQLLRPFSDEPLGLGSMFIIDPLYTVPLLVGVIAALRLSRWQGLRWNVAGLVLSTAYLGWSMVAQQHVKGIAAQALSQQSIRADRLLVTPAPFNTVLWRVVAVEGDRYHEGFWSFMDGSPDISFDRFPRGLALSQRAPGDASVARIARFSDGFYRLRQRQGYLSIADLRMGQEPGYVFEFDVARLEGTTATSIKPQAVGQRGDLGAALRWLGRRMLGERLPPPR